MVEIFKGEEITSNQIEAIKNIASKRYSKEIYDEYFSRIKDIKDLARLHNVKDFRETIAIGTDWFLCYAELDYHVEILEWVAVDNENKFGQSIEMMNTLKQLFLRNKKKIFVAGLRHDTSYAMYRKMLQEGYFKEIRHRWVIDCAAPEQVYEIEEFNSIENFLTGDTPDEYTEYLKYILHHLSFMLSNKFVKKYEKLPKKPKGKKLKSNNSH